jgi:hypothetical protein
MTAVPVSLYKAYIIFRDFNMEKMKGTKCLQIMGENERVQNNSSHIRPAKDIDKCYETRCDVLQCKTIFFKELH